LSLAPRTLPSSDFSPKFDDHAFDGVKIDSISFVFFNGVATPPTALKQLGAQGLVKYAVSDCPFGTSSTVNSNAFQDFKNLTTLWIADCSISSIADDAFNGIGSSLHYLYFTAADVTQYPEAVTQNLGELTYLDLSQNKIASIPKNAFLLFPKLKFLDMSSNPLAGAIERGSLDVLPASLRQLSLSDMGLTVVPKSMLRDRPNLQSLELYRNNISVIRSDDFLYAQTLTILSLSTNPVSMVEPGAFRTLSSLQELDFSIANFKSIDLSILAGASGASPSLQVYFDFSKSLEKISIAKLEGFPKINTSISLKLTTVQTIDSSLCRLLQLHENTQLDISGSDKLQCEGLEWIAPFVYCTNQVAMGDGVYAAFCADKNMKLDDYLKMTSSPGSCVQKCA